MRLQDEIPESEPLYPILLALCEQIEMLTDQVLRMRADVEKLLHTKRDEQKKLF